MLINLQGYGHFQDGINNQDFGFEEKKMILIVDGCTGMDEETNQCAYSESGGRMFVQLFKTLKNHNDPKMFEENIKYTFESIIKWLKDWYPNEEELENFILDNYLFTIIGLFDQGDHFEVKAYGDGYIFSINENNLISYMKLNYGKRPPYYAYNYCSKEIKDIFKNYHMKSFKFPKKMFKNIGIATDGIQPIAKGAVSQVDNFLKEDYLLDRIKTAIEQEHYLFYDDVTLGILNNGGK